MKPVRPRKPTKVWRDLLQSILEATEHVHVPCDFKQGTCINTRRTFFYRSCCCDSCGPARGCLYRGFREHLSPREYNRIMTRHDPRKGFSTSKGCALPRKHRSPICVFFICRYLTARHSDIADRLDAYRAMYFEVASSASSGRWL